MTETVADLETNRGHGALERKVIDPLGVVECPVHVQDHGIDLVFLGLKHVKCVTAIDGGDHFVTILAEQGSVQLPNPRVVVHAHHG